MAYKVDEHRLERAGDFKVLVLVMPKEEIEDKLAYLAREKGVVTRSLFEDWLIANCVANINQLLYSINQNIESGTGPDLVEIREELISSIIKSNPLLDSSKLIINSNHVIKFKGQRKKLAGDEVLLDENKHWDTSYYDNPETNSIPGANGKKKKKVLKKTKLKDISDLKPIDALQYAVTQKWWSRIGQYVKIKNFDEDDAENILRSKYFHSSTSFQTFIVTVCIEDFEGLFSLLDNMGVPNRIAAPILMKELYDLCKDVNDFLTFENCQNMAEDDEEDDDTPYHHGKPRSSGGSMSQYAKSDKKKLNKKRFKDVAKEDLLRLGDNMKVFLIGQNKAIDLLSDSIQRASVGLKDPSKPIGSFLFAGRTGVGKTLATKVLADELIRSRENMVTIDCSEFSSDHEYAKLIGAPAGYVGHENGGMLTNAVSKNPFTVVVFDEIEKASHKVHGLLLQILEEGRLTDGKGKLVSFKDTVIVLTSNVGVKEVEDIKRTVGFGDVAKVTENKKEGALDKALKKKFKPEFLNRIDSIVHFNTLDKRDYMRIIDLELYKLNDNLKSNDTEFKDLTLKFDDKVKNLIYTKGIDEKFGARPLKREIEKLISTPLAKKLLTDNVGVDSVIEVSAYRKKAVFVVAEKVEELPFYMTNEYQKVADKVKSVGE